MSGAGRSTALRVLEDLGFYCVDNLPPSLASELVKISEAGGIDRIAMGMDVRTGTEGIEPMLEAFSDSGHSPDVLFLDCSVPVLIRRYSESRRPHPLAPAGDVPSGIHKEKERLSSLRARATYVLDTTDLSVHDLKRAVIDWFKEHTDSPTMVTRILSFGFKYGVPMDADLVFDLRFLPNPYFIPELKPKTGLEKEVSDYVLSTEGAQQLLKDLEPLLLNTLPRYQAEGKSYLTIAIGCTGGKHRSVAMTEELQKILERAGHHIRVAHRDVHRSKLKK